jgi:hypothetical protein
MKLFKLIIKYIVVFAATSLFLSCGNKVTLNVDAGSTSVYVGGVIANLAAGESVTLQNNGDMVTVAGVGSGLTSVPFVFAIKVKTGTNYNVTVSSQPVAKTCVVGGNSGTAATTDIMSIYVTCTGGGVVTYTVGGTITGLTGTGLVLKNLVNAITGDFSNPNPLAISYSFPTTLPTGATYSVSVFSQPTNPSQNCTVVYSAR